MKHMTELTQEVKTLQRKIDHQTEILEDMQVPRDNYTDAEKQAELEAAVGRVRQSLKDLNVSPDSIAEINSEVLMKYGVRKTPNELLRLANG